MFSHVQKDKQAISRNESQFDLGMTVCSARKQCPAWNFIIDGQPVQGNFHPALSPPSSDPPIRPSGLGTASPITVLDIADPRNL
jgi:hypothetical protein